MRRTGVLIALAGLAIGMMVGPNHALGVHEPANKVSAAGSSTEVAGPGERILLMSERIRTSTPEDLILAVTAECALVTDVVTIGDDSQRAFGSVKVWVEIDGAAVPVAQDDPDAGRVVFCNRAYQRDTLNLGDDDTISTFLRTRNANGFNWLALNVGSGVHTINVYAELVQEQTARAHAEAVVGNRTLVIEPVKAANDEVVTELA